MRYFVCLLVAMVAFVTGVQAGSPAKRPQRGQAFVYTFDSPRDWGLCNVPEFASIDCVRGRCSLSMRAHDIGDGSIIDGCASRLIDEIPRTTAFRVSAWINGDEAQPDTGVRFAVIDQYRTWSNALEFLRDRYVLRTVIYRRDIGPGWQRVQLGVIGPIDYILDLTNLYIDMVTPLGSPDTHWLVGQIEFSPAPDLDDQSPASDLP